MRIEVIEIKGFTIWLTIDQLKTYKNDMKILKNENEFLCYFKTSEPNSLYYGELFKDSNGIPKLFKSSDEAIQYAENELKNKIK